MFATAARQVQRASHDARVISALTYLLVTRMRVVQRIKAASVGDYLFALLVAWTLVVSAITVRLQLRRAPAANTAVPSAKYVKDWKGLATRGFAYGPANAANTLVVFTDFQCPYCRQFASVLDSLTARHPDVRVVERHFPLASLHEAAFDAAQAAECARELGKYPEMRTVLYRRAGLVTERMWTELARHAGIPKPDVIGRCVKSARYATAINTDKTVAEALGVVGTPTFVLNDSLYRGTTSLAELEQRLARRVSGR